MLDIMVPSTSAFAAERPVAPAYPWFPPAATAVVGLAPRACRWPLGEPRSAGFAFCGAARRAGASYCPQHAGLSRRAGPGSRA